ncbi:hypothetical protein KK211_17905 [Pseudomonas aeruginosa]|uniref:hypothetical protein n=1 Tax=Pseudomonas aeruginosa TaxID=287 RepID=UPI00235899F5|nr:hypothetical protein KK211_17905 [Pseudomonas aeruginosa]
MSKHTPGPWTVDFIDGVDGVFAECDKRICQVDEVDIVGWNARFRDESEANAKLIAAAPDLLEALQQAVTSMQDSGYPNDSVVIRAARQAITKATA